MTRGLRLPIESRAAKNLVYYFYKKEVERRGNAFALTESLRERISEVGKFLCDEDRKYGLFFPGTVGNGKTTMLKAIRDVLVYLTDTGQIDFCEGSKYPRYETACGIAESMIYDRPRYQELKTSRHLFIDELGSEQTEIVSYGIIYRPFYDILSYRYENNLPTFVTSNLNAEDIALKYDDERVVDRMGEMFEIISFTEESFR